MVFGLFLSFNSLTSDSQYSPKQIFAANKASANTGGGPIVLDGMDPVCHSGYEGTWEYIAQVLKKTHDQASNQNDGSIAILGANGATNSCGGNWNTLLTTKYLSQFTAQPTVNFYNSSTQVSNFFANINTLKPAIIWIPDNWVRSAAIESLFTSNAEVIADFVNSGGGLFANNGSYGWLTALLPSAVYNNGGCNGGPDATVDGNTDFGLTNIMVAACWHGYFTGNVGTLKVLVDYPYPSPTDTRKAVSIGGGEVSLPSSFTLAISPTNPEAGQDLVITATAQTISGVPQAGVTVTVTVSSGPDAGQVLTATTDASGIATITVRTNSVGTAVYTATATVNGVAKTVSTTVTWDPPSTTTTSEPPETTTTEVATTTTEPEATTTTVQETVATTIKEAEKTTVPASDAVAPTTTEQEVQTVDGQWVAPVEVGQTTTTVHDHSTHSHGPKLPTTGMNPVLILILGLILTVLGYFLSIHKTIKQ